MIHKASILLLSAVASLVETVLGGDSGRLVAENLNETDMGFDPIEAFAFPGYANWTSHGWNLRIRGNAYRPMKISNFAIEKTSNDLIKSPVSVATWPDLSRSRMYNISRSFFVAPWPGVQVTMQLVDDVNMKLETAGGAISAKGGAQEINLPSLTTVAGNFEALVHLMNTVTPGGTGLAPGDEMSQTQVLRMHAEGLANSHSAAYLVPEQGITVVTSLDSIIDAHHYRQIYQRDELPWKDIDKVYANWSASNHNMHFHYMTQRPPMLMRNHFAVVHKYFPPGSFDAPLLEMEAKTDHQQSPASSRRRPFLEAILQSFPKRQFVLVGDGEDEEVMRVYPQIYRDYAGQISCLFFRNHSGIQPPWAQYDASRFAGIPPEKVMFFRDSPDLAHLDIARGDCLNKTVPQDISPPPDMKLGLE